MRRLIVFLWCLLLLVACGRASTATRPAPPPAATTLEEGDNAMTDLMATTLREYGSEAEMEVTSYRLEREATWQTVASHYAALLAAEGWAVDEGLSMTFDPFHQQGWKRGGIGQREIFIINFALDPTEGWPLLTTAHMPQ